MPWKERSVMDERLRFIARLLEGEAMSEVCREFGISRKPGLHKVYDQHAYLDEKRHALELWAGRLRSIVEPAPANVVPLRA